MLRIGILDSGLGGLAAARILQDRFPGCGILFFGDTARAPYGPKSLETVRRFAFQGADFLTAHGAGMVVIGCGTIASVAAKDLAKRVSVPVIDPVASAVSEAVQRSRYLRIGLLASPASIAGGGFREAVERESADARLYSAACPLLISLVEAGWLKKPETVRIIKKVVHPLRTRQIDTLILGATHLGFLKRIIQAKAGRQVRIVDLFDNIEGQVSRGIEFAQASDCKAVHRFFVTDMTEETQKIACRIFGQRVCLELAGNQGRFSAIASDREVIP